MIVAQKNSEASVPGAADARRDEAETHVLTITGTADAHTHHAFSLCALRGGEACWVAWDNPYEAFGSRAFVRLFDGTAFGAVLPLSDSDQPQIGPRCIPGPKGAIFLWYEKDGETYLVCRRTTRGAALSPREALFRLPEWARPGGIQATLDEEGVLWLAWSQAEPRRSVIRVARCAGSEGPQHWTIGAGAHRDYRPQLTALSRGAHLVWDAYAEGTYDVFGCALSEQGPSSPVRISRDREWESKAALCRDRDGALWCAWVRWQDVMWKHSVLHQKFSIRGARYDGRAWRPLAGADGGPDIAPLHYGLLTDLDRKRPALGHRGRRLHPMLKAAADGGAWLLYESKADDAAQTQESTGRLLALHGKDDRWSEPLNVAECLTFYETPTNEVTGGEMFLAARDVAMHHLFLLRVRLARDLPRVPAECRTVDLTHWKDTTLPLSGLQDPSGARTRLSGPAQGRYQLLWGDFHVHSVGSVECEGELDQIAHYARDKARIHALTLSDNDGTMGPADWDANVGNALVLNAPGRFALFPGYEQTIGGPLRERLLRNHSSVMADDDHMERETFHLDPQTRRAVAEGRRRSNKDVVACVEWARRKGYLPLSHAHYNWWRIVDPAVQTCCDVTTAWMRNIEEFEIYHAYLNQGVRFGFTGSSDSHYRNPGFGGALTGLWVREITRAGVLEALRARRTYATSGARILIEFAVNDAFMGEWIVVDDDPVIRWRVSAPNDEECRLRVMRNGRPMYEATFQGETADEVKEEQLRFLRPGRHYYYLQVDPVHPVPTYPSNVAHALGSHAWSTPVWVETADWIVL